MLHSLIYSHTIFHHQKMGETVVCQNKWTSKIRQVTWYPVGSYDVERITVDPEDFEEFMLFEDPVAALRWVVKQNGDKS